MNTSTAARTDLLPHPTMLGSLTPTQIRAFRRLMRLDAPAKPRAFRCIVATADALVGAGLAVVENGLYRSALIPEIEAEASAWFDLNSGHSFALTGIVTVARPGKALHYFRFALRYGGSITAEVLPVKGFPMVNSTPLQLDRLKTEGWQVVAASDEDRETLRSAGFGFMLPEPVIEVEPIAVETPAPSPWDRPFRLVAAVREDQRDWFFSARQQRIAVVLGQSDYEPPAKVSSSPVPPVGRVVGILGYSYRIEPLPIAPCIGTVAFSLVDLDRKRLHHVHRTIAGEVLCDCGDFTYRRSGTGEPCKHGRKLIELGLITSSTPTVLPPFSRRSNQPRTTTTLILRHTYLTTPAEEAESRSISHE